MTSPKPKTFALIAAAGVCLVGVVVLLGWAFDVAAIKSLGPGWPKMVPLTALVFVLAGLSLWGETSAGAAALRVAHVGALLVVAAGTLRLAEDLLGIPHAFDMLGFRETSPPGGSPSRMAPTAACSFQLIGCALLLARRAEFALHFHVLAFVAGLNGVLGLFRYLAGGEAWLPLRFMAVHTSASFVLLAAGVVCLRPHGGLIELLLADRRHGILSKPAAYGLAVVLTGFTLLVRVTIGNAPENPTLIIFTIPIILSAYWGGLGPGLLATFLAGIGADYFVLTPRYGLGLSSTTERWQVAVLFLSGGLICFICMRLQRARERTEAMVAELQWESVKRQEADERAHWLASFPERNPNPIAEFDPQSGTLLYANPAASALLPGLAGEGLQHPGLDLAREIVHGWKGAHPDVARCEASLAGSCYLLTVTCDPQTRRARIYGSDITERKRAEDALRESEELFAKSFRLSPDCVAIVRATDRTVIQANDALCALWDATPAEVIGKPTPEYARWVNEEERLAFMQTLEASGECLNYETKLQLVGDRFVDFNISSRMITFQGESCILSVMRDVTERRRVEATAARLAAIVESSVDAIIGTDIFGIVTSWNGGAEKIFGYTGQEIVGQSIMRLIPPERADEEEEIFARIQRGESIPPFDTVRRLKDGRSIDIAVTVSAIKNHAGQIVGASKVARDITERKRTAAALQESEQRLRGILDTMFVFVGLMNLDGEIVEVNHAPLEVAGLKREDVIGRTVPESYWFSYSPTVQARVQKAVACAAEGKIMRDDYLIRIAGGGFISIDTTFAPLRDAAGRVTQVVGSAVDITERKKAEEQNQQLNAELEQRVIERTVQLESANKELEAFSYSVSHDLRAPLRAVDGFSQAVLEDYGPQLPEEGQRYLQTIRGGAQKMGVLIDDLLTFSRLSRAPLKKQEVNTGELVRSVLEDLHVQREGRQIDLRVGELPACDGDPALLRQVWINLLSNAFKYSREREVAVVEIGCDTGTPGDVYFVRDNGTGFDMRYADKLFGVFQRLHRAEDYEGTGVGLAIVQRIVHRHGGRIWAEAEEGRGAMFYFTLAEKTKP